RHRPRRRARRRRRERRERRPPRGAHERRRRPRPARRRSAGAQPMRPARRTGSSALELVVTVAVFAMAMGGLAGVLQSAASWSSLFGEEGGLDEKSWQVTEGIVKELRFAQASTLLLTTEFGSSRLDFRVATGYVAGAVVWSSTITIKVQASN